MFLRTSFFSEMDFVNPSWEVLLYIGGVIIVSHHVLTAFQNVDQLFYMDFLLASYYMFLLFNERKVLFFIHYSISIYVLCSLD